MEPSEIARFIIRIEENINPDSTYYGELVKWWDEKNQLWHYGIGLSNTHFFNIGTIRAKKLPDELQLLRRHDIIEHDIIEQEQRDLDIRVIYSIHSPFERDEIIERLKYALRWFNDLPEDSDYKEQLTGKALSSLILTGDKDSIPKEEIVPPFPEAVKGEIEFKEYLKQNSPQLKYNKVKEIFENRVTWAFILTFFFIVAAYYFIPKEESDIAWIRWLLRLGIVGAALSLVMLFVKISNFKWSGFQKKNFWDWLQLLIVPLMLLVGAVYLNAASERKDEEIAEERKQQEIFKDYLSKMQNLIIQQAKIYGTPRNGKLLKEYKPMARALTLAVLDELDGKRKGKVITYLSESGFINIDDPIIDLTKANLNKIVLKGVYLLEVNLSGAYMIEAKLTDVKFANANLGGSNFSEATLKNITFLEASLNDSNFYDATLEDIKISRKTRFWNPCYSNGTIVRGKASGMQRDDGVYLLLTNKQNLHDRGGQKITYQEECKPPRPPQQRQEVIGQG